MERHFLNQLKTISPLIFFSEKHHTYAAGPVGITMHAW